MRAAFIPALPPSALLAGMIAPSFRLVNRFCVKSCFARAAAVSGRPRCARYGLGRRSLMCCFARAAAMSGRPRCARYGLGRRSLMSKGPCPLTARCGIGRLCGERRRRERCERLKGAKGSACPVGTWAEGPKRPEARRREASALWAVARSAKRPEGVSKYKGCARSARRTPIFARAAKP